MCSVTHYVIRLVTKCYLKFSKPDIYVLALVIFKIILNLFASLTEFASSFQHVIITIAVDL